MKTTDPKLGQSKSDKSTADRNFKSEQTRSADGAPSPLDARMRLLGLSTCLPSPELSRDSEFATNEEYLSFLTHSLQHTADHWKKIADELIWIERPVSVGKAGDWFPGGLLNIASVCLGDSVHHKEQDAPLVWEFDSATQKKSSLSRQDLGRTVESIAAHIRRWNLPAGSPILVALPGGAEMIACMLACLRSGYPVVPIDPTYSKSRVTQRILAARCKGILCDEKVFATIKENAEVASELKSNIATPQEAKLDRGEPGPLQGFGAMHPAFILADSLQHLYTIPTAGFLLQAISSFKFLLGDSKAKDTLWTLAPSHHASTLAAVFGAIASGCSIGALPILAAKNDKTFLATIAGADAAVLFADVKTVLEAINPALDQNYRPAVQGPDIFIIEGETLTPRIWNYLLRGLFNSKTHIAQVLSRPECGGFLTGPHPRVTPVRISSVGLPAPGISIAVIELQEGECPVGEGGVLSLTEPTPGLAIELQTAEMPLPVQVKARRDKTGYLWSMGEVKVERSKTQRITLAEVEAAIASVDEVTQVAVIRYYNEDNQPRTRAFVQWDSAAPTSAQDEARKKIEQALIEHCGESTLPNVIQFVSNLPYSRSGKLLRSVLRRISKGDPLRSEDLHLISDPQIADEYKKGSD